MLQGNIAPSKVVNESSATVGSAWFKQMTPDQTNGHLIYAIRDDSYNIMLGG